MTTPGITRTFHQIRPGRIGVGTDWVVTPGGQRWWRIISLTARLATSAAVANRRVRLEAVHGDGTYFVAEAHLNQVGSTTRDYAAHTGSPIGAADSLVLPLPLPTGGLLVRPGGLLRVTTAGLDVGDQWSAVIGLAEQIPSGPEYWSDNLAPSWQLNER